MVEVTKEMVERALAANVIDYRADDDSERTLSVSDAMQRYGFHHPIDPAELVTAIVKAAFAARLPVAFTVESKAWEAHAASHKLNLCQHPLHYLYLDHTTHEARQAWKAALEFSAKHGAQEIGNG